MHTTGAFNDICNNYLYLKQQKRITKPPIHLLHKTGQGSHVVVSGSLYAVVGRRSPPRNHYLHKVQSSNSPPFSTLLLAISFAQVGQVLYCSEISYQTCTHTHTHTHTHTAWKTTYVTHIIFPGMVYICVVVHNFVDIEDGYK